MALPKSQSHAPEIFVDLTTTISHPIQTQLLLGTTSHLLHCLPRLQISLTMLLQKGILLVIMLLHLILVIVLLCCICHQSQ